MGDFRCPGQDMRQWKPKDIFEVRCPACEAQVEFFKDDPLRHCPSCGGDVRNPRIDLGCAKWCKYAEECLGHLHETTTDRGPICERLIVEMEKYFGDDRRRIDHARSVLSHAEEILTEEEGDPLTVRAAAILHDIGIPEAERKHNSAAGNLQEEEGPPIARKIMSEVSLDEEVIDHVCRIVGAHHSGKGIDTPEFRVIWDADWLVNLPAAYADADRKALAGVIEQVFRTEAGKRLARKRFIDQEVREES